MFGFKRKAKRKLKEYEYIKKSIIEIFSNDGKYDNLIPDEYINRFGIIFDKNLNPASINFSGQTCLHKSKAKIYRNVCNENYKSSTGNSYYVEKRGIQTYGGLINSSGQFVPMYSSNPKPLSEQTYKGFITAYDNDVF